MLDFRINTFLKLCETKSYTLTAQMLNITQPTVTQHIKYLERNYNVELFTYRRRVLSLTDKGKKLLAFAISMNANSNKIYEIMSADEKLNLNFGTTLTIGEFIMPDIISKYVKEFPMNNICMNVNNTENLINDLKSGKIDFAFIEGNFSKYEFDYYTFGTEELIAVCSNENKYAEKTINFEELLSQRVIIKEKGSGTREVLESVLRRNNLSLSDFLSQVEVSNFNAIKKLVSDNIGIAFLYVPAVKSELKSGKFKRIYIKNLNVVRDYMFVFLKNSLFKDDYINFFNFCYNEYSNS